MTDPDDAGEWHPARWWVEALVVGGAAAVTALEAWGVWWWLGR